MEVKYVAETNQKNLLSLQPRVCSSKLIRGQTKSLMLLLYSIYDESKPRYPCLLGRQGKANKKGVGWVFDFSNTPNFLGIKNM